MPKKAKIGLNDIVDCIFAFLLIYFTRSMWPSIPTLSAMDVLMKALFVGMLLFKIMLSHLKKKKAHYIILLGVVLLYLFGYIVVRPTSIEPYAKMVLFAIGAMVYQACETRTHSAFRFYVQLVYYIAILSLVFWLFGSIMGIIHPSGTVYSTWTGSEQRLVVNNYYYIYFEPQRANILSFVQIPRNSSMFAEAPMFCFHLSIVLLYELFIKEKLDLKRVAVLLICIISTISMTGYVVSALALAIKYIVTGERKSTFKIIRALLLPAIIVVLSIVLEKMITSKLGSYSGGVRLDDFRAGYKAWMNNPLFGNGYNNIKAIQQYMSGFRLNNMGFSNSPMLILAYGGVYLAIPYIVAVYFSIKRSIGNKEKICFVLLFVFLFTVTIVPFQPLVPYVFSWLITEERVPVSKVKEPNKKRLLKIYYNR